PAIHQQLAEAASRDGSAVAGVLSPFLTCEEAYLLARYMKSLSSAVQLVLGPVPMIGENDAYPKDRHGKPIEPVNFTIRAEKCPNRRGVEAILRHFQGELLTMDQVLQAAAAGYLQALYLTAAYPPREAAWIREDQAELLERVPFVVVQD